MSTKSKVTEKSKEKNTAKPKATTPKAEKVVKAVEVKKEEIMPVEEKTLFIVRIRSAPGMRQTIKLTLQLFNLHKVNHATIVRTNPSILGMLQKAKDYIAYGEITQDMLAKLIKKRGLLTGNKPITDAHVKFATPFDSIANLAKGIKEGKIKLRDVPELKPIFRLHPPIGGHKGTIKKAVKSGGVLGNWGEKINELVKQML